MTPLRLPFLLVVLLLVAGALSPAQAQFGKRLKDAAKSRAESKTIDKVLEKQDKAIDEVFDGPESTTGAPAAAESESAATDASPEELARLRPGEGAWANYDFVPGERVLFVDDFSADRVGNFPQRLEFVSGNQEIVEWKGTRYLRATSYGSVFDVSLPEVLPDRFTMEVDVAPQAGGWDQHVTVGDETAGRVAQVVFGYHRAGIDANGAGGGESVTALDGRLSGGVYTLRVMADGDYVKVYQNEQRVANVPNARLGRSSVVRFTINASVDEPVLLSNIRVMAGGLPLYDALEAEGHVAVQGIYFDTGSDVLRPESTPTLAEIGHLMATYPALALVIEGHTDATGSADANQALSEKRAAAVRAYLVDVLGADASRLDAAGFGPSRPVASNDTPEGRQQNRRVELRKRG